MGIVGLFVLPLLNILSTVIDLYFKVVAVDIILYWLLRYKILSVHNKYSKKFMEILKNLTEPVYKVIRQKVSPISGYDVAPYVLLVAIIFVYQFVSNLTKWIDRYM